MAFAVRVAKDDKQGGKFIFYVIKIDSVWGSNTVYAYIYTKYWNTTLNYLKIL